MRTPRWKTAAWAGMAMLLSSAWFIGVTGCPPDDDDGDDDGNPPPPPTNTAPTASAGGDLIVKAGELVTLSGSGSDADGDSLSFAWRQTHGTPVVLDPAAQPAAKFTAPAKNATLKFQLTVSDGEKEAASSANVQVQAIETSEQVNVSERMQRSVLDDPAVRGDFPKDWLIPDAAAGLEKSTDKDEVFEFKDTFARSRAPKIVQEQLLPGETRVVQLDIAGASGLAGMTQWIGTTDALEVKLLLNNAELARGSAYRMGKDRGGCYVRTVADQSGTAAVSVTNTSTTSVQVRILFMATAL